MTLKTNIRLFPFRKTSSLLSFVILQIYFQLLLLPVWVKGTAHARGEIFDNFFQVINGHFENWCFHAEAFHVYFYSAFLPQHLVS